MRGWYRRESPCPHGPKTCSGLVASGAQAADTAILFILFILSKAFRRSPVTRRPLAPGREPADADDASPSQTWGYAPRSAVRVPPVSFTGSRRTRSPVAM